MHATAERIRELEFSGLFRILPPRIVSAIVTRECDRMTSRLYARGLGFEPEDEQPDTIEMQEAGIVRRGMEF